jgi:hypothetical protein
MSTVTKAKKRGVRVALVITALAALGEDGV